MSWRAIAITDVRLSPQERAAMQNIQDSTTLGAAILLTVVREFVGTAKAARYAVAKDDTVPDSARLHIINRTRWMWLVEFPQLKSFQTEAREQLNESAEEFLALVRAGEASIEPPTSDDTARPANWNSENKIIGRAHPVPRPATQLQPQDNRYANPNGPADQTNAA